MSKELKKWKDKCDHLERELKTVELLYRDLLSLTLQDVVDTAIKRFEGQKRDFNLKDFLIEEMKKRNVGKTD